MLRKGGEVIYPISAPSPFPRGLFPFSTVSVSILWPICPFITPIEKNLAPQLIGKSGVNIKSMKRKSEASISIKEYERGVYDVVITGVPKNVEVRVIESMSVVATQTAPVFSASAFTTVALSLCRLEDITSRTVFIADH